jgi:photosystem II stability/assembly factor-like uncharacterized protein
MKKLIFICLFIFSGISLSQEYWIHKPSPTTKWLTRILFVDTLYGWAAGDSGTIIHTSNGGQNWIVQNTGIVGYPIDDFFFLNRNLGWGVANDYFFYGSKILKTTNGGNNWQMTVFPDTTQVFNTIHFLDSLNGYLSGYSGNVFKTTNGGINWLEQHVDTNYCPILNLFPKANFGFSNSQTGYTCGGHIDIQGMIWKTNDFGHNWLTYCLTPEPLNRILSIGPQRVLATGGDYEYGLNIVNSYDGGNTWLYDTSVHIWGIGRALAFRTPAELWIPTAIGQSWAVSLDSGGHQKPWLVFPCPDTTSAYDALFVTPAFGWACGTNGALLKYNPDIIGIPGGGNYVPSNYELYQNYPNPFNPATTISYYLPRISHVVITIYELTGREVRKYIEGIKPGGHHKLRFTSNGLASGVYFYSIKAGDFTRAKKMVILK